MKLKDKAISGLSWGLIDNMINQGVVFLVGLFLARLITPSEFGLLGVITFFMVLSNIFIDSGLGQALIRKMDCTEKDYSTVFYFNIVIGLLLYGILYLLAPLIATFFNEQSLISLTRYNALVIPISAISIIQRVNLTKKVDFKTQAKISFLSASVSGVTAILLAINGYGVWSLVWRNIVGTLLTSFLLLFFNRWVPILCFSKKSFHELFGFGSKLMVTYLINTIYNSIYTLIIGKYYSFATLGYYTRAELFSSVAITFSSSVERASFPVFSSIQDDNEKLKNAYKRIVKSSMFLIFTALLGLAAIAPSLIIVLIGETWQPCIIYLQLMCFSKIMHPLQVLSLNVLNVKGKSALVLRLEVIKKIIYIPFIIVGVYLGVEALLIGIIITSGIAYFLNCICLSPLINYPIKDQIKDLLPFFGKALVVSIPVWLLSFLPLSHYYIFTTQLITWIGLSTFLFEYLKIPEYLEVKEIFFSATQRMWRYIKKQNDD